MQLLNCRVTRAALPDTTRLEDEVLFCYVVVVWPLRGASNGYYWAPLDVSPVPAIQW